MLAVRLPSTQILNLPFFDHLRRVRVELLQPDILFVFVAGPGVVSNRDVFRLTAQFDDGPSVNAVSILIRPLGSERFKFVPRQNRFATVVSKNQCVVER